MPDMISLTIDLLIILIVLYIWLLLRKHINDCRLLIRHLPYDFMKNTKDELTELNEKSNIIHRFLADGQVDFNFSMFNNEEEYGLEYIFTVDLADNKTKLNIIANTEGGIYFEVFKCKNKTNLKNY